MRTPYVNTAESNYINSSLSFLNSSSTFGVAQAVELPDHWDLGYPDSSEMDDYKLQLQQFVSEWGRMQSALTAVYSVLDIGDKSPEDLLQEMVLQMESECNRFCSITQTFVTPQTVFILIGQNGKSGFKSIPYYYGILPKIFNGLSNNVTTTATRYPVC